MQVAMEAMLIHHSLVLVVLLSILGRIPFSSLVNPQAFQPKMRTQIAALKHGEVQGYPTIEWFYNGHDHRVRLAHTLSNKQSEAAALHPKF